MRTSAALAFAAASLFSQVSGTIYVTNPVASTVCTAGQQCTVAWNDDGNAPVLATIGACSIDLCTGGVTQQTCLQNISPSTDVSQNAQVTYSPNPTIGPNGNAYFIKFTSLAYKDPTNPTFPYTSFSAKVTLAGMTGTFNATIQAENAGAAAPAAVGGTTAPAASSTPAASSGIVTKVSTASSTAKPTTTAKATSGAAANFAASLPGAALLAGLVMGAAALL